MRFGPIIYVVLGLVLSVLGGMFFTRFGWPMDIAWILIAASAFVFAPEVTLAAGLVFGLTLDGLTGTGSLVYTLSYTGFGAIIAYGRRPFFLEGLLPGWIAALIGAEVLWLFIGGYARAINMLGGHASVPGWQSPFLLSVLIGYPFAFWLAKRFLPRGTESRSHGYKISRTVKT